MNYILRLITWFVVRYVANINNYTDKMSNFEKNSKYRKIMRQLVILLLLFATCSCHNVSTGEYRSFEGVVWATTFHITYRSGVQLDDSIRAVMREVEESLSPFSPTSLVSSINKGSACVADSMFRHIFNVSMRVNALSGGMFDPTVAPLVNLWGFGYANGKGRPTPQAVDSALQAVGMSQCRMVGDTVVKKSPETEFDFSSITKGYGCDLIGEMLRRNGCNDYMVEIGGEIALGGKSPRADDWHIMIDAPVENDTVIVHERMAVMALSDCGIATSGNYRNYRDTESGRVGHTISPVTGHPVTTNTLSATVVAPDAMLADALATACMAMPLDLAMSMIEGLHRVEAMLVTADGKGGWELHVTSGFPELRR